ncbi:hypothetical protein F4779DRAFT_636178 [Xylariaceae sp. FL0662B]|nr:hypothetical protein F4779DRAFT_636178 [Xylariaceae sp. FL0662B]
MCRKTIIHQMHHDVRTPMIIDPTTTSPPVYANPRRTKYHVCELALPVPGQMLLNSKPSCKYHSCCIPAFEVEYCLERFPVEPVSSTMFQSSQDRKSAIEQDSDLESDSESDYSESSVPEECTYFVLTHRHVRMPYFGDESAYVEEYPATWADIKEPGSDWITWCLDCAGCEVPFYFECEKLYQLEKDVQTLLKVMMDLSHTRPPSSRQRATAELSLLRAEGWLNYQRMVVFGLLDLAREPAASF